MKKFIAIGFGLAAITVFASITVLASEFPFVRKGDETIATADCKIAIRNGIQSIYPDAQIAKVREYYCARSYREDPATGGDPTKLKCRGKYEQTITVQQWFQRKLAGEQFSSAVRDGDTVILQRETRSVELNQSQKTAHSGILTQCIGGIDADNLIDFLARKSGSDVLVQANFIDKVSTEAELFDLDKSGKVLFILQQQ